MLPLESHLCDDHTIAACRAEVQSNACEKAYYHSEEVVETQALKEETCKIAEEELER